MRNTRYAAMKTITVTGAERVNVGASQKGLIYNRDSYSKT
jgi:hypothetical protein